MSFWIPVDEGFKKLTIMYRVTSFYIQLNSSDFLKAKIYDFKKKAF